MKRFGRWIFCIVPLALAFLSLTPFAYGAPNFNEAGKAMGLFLEKFHFSKHKFDDDLSEKALEMYLKSLDPSKIYFTQKDVDSLRSKFATDLDDYLRDGDAMQVARPLYTLYILRVEQRVKYADELLKNGEFKFDRKEYADRSRRNVEWPRDEEEMKKVWRDRIERELLAETLRREMADILSPDGENRKPDASEKPPRKKLAFDYDRMLRNLKELSDAEDVAEALLNAVAMVYDPHTAYMGVRMSSFFKSAVGGACTGLGILVRMDDDGGVRIDGLLPGGPAEKSGELHPDDRIVGIDPGNTGKLVDIRYMNLDKIIDLMGGADGFVIRLKLEPAADPEQSRFVTLKCAQVELKDELAQGRIAEVRRGKSKTLKLGILRLPGFYLSNGKNSHRSGVDFENILKRMVGENINGLVIDLRHNGGGSLDEVVHIVGLLTGPGPVTRLKDGAGKEEIYRPDCQKALFKGPVVLLVDKLSASASELMAAALQDYGRAVIAGGPATFGKGSAQQIMDMGALMSEYSDRSRAGCLKVTMNKFYRISGVSTQLKGVESDIVLPNLTVFCGESEDKRDFALPYDQVSPSEGYVKDKWIGKVLPVLRKRSEERVLRDADFRIITEEMKRLEKQEKENKISLNKEEREQYMRERAEFIKSVNDERKERYARTEKKEASRYRMYRLSLDDVDVKKLPEIRDFQGETQKSRYRKETKETLSDFSGYPFGLDPELREGLNIVTDMADLKKGISPAKLERLPEEAP